MFTVCTVKPYCYCINITEVAVICQVLSVGRGLTSVTLCACVPVCQMCAYFRTKVD